MDQKVTPNTIMYLRGYLSPKYPKIGADKMKPTKNAV